MAHSVAGRLWVAAGDVGTGTAELEKAGSRRRSGTAAGRLAAWEALGQARLARGDRRGAMVAVARALAVVEEQQASLGATEIGRHVAVHAKAAASLGLRLAVEGNRAKSIWQWMERHRANSLRPFPARPPRDDALAALLAELRNVSQEITTCITEGGDPTALLARQDELEHRARERAWKSGASGGGNLAARSVRASDVPGALGEAALVEFGDIEGYMHVVVVSGGRWRHRRLAPTMDVERELGHVRLALRRLAYGEAQSALAAGAQEQLARASSALDRLLFGPVAIMLGTRPVVVVPTGELFSAPWGVLPTLFGRAVTVAPSSQLWLEATSRARTPAAPAAAGAGRGPDCRSCRPGAFRRAR